MSEEVLDKVRETLVDALGVDDDEVTPEATLVGDLGAESIDFLDIVFRLEKAFDVSIPRAELFPENLASADLRIRRQWRRDGSRRRRNASENASRRCRKLRI